MSSSSSRIGRALLEIEDSTAQRIHSCHLSYRESGQPLDSVTVLARISEVRIRVYLFRSSARVDLKLSLLFPDLHTSRVMRSEIKLMDFSMSSLRHDAVAFGEVTLASIFTILQVSHQNSFSRPPQLRLHFKIAVEHGQTTVDVDVGMQRLGIPGWVPVDLQDRGTSNLSDIAVGRGNQVLGPINAPKGRSDRSKSTRTVYVDSLHRSTNDVPNLT
jgi:hypothetical protein